MGNTEANDFIIYYAFGLVLCSFLSSSITNPFLMFTFQKGLQIRIAICSMIYDKVKEDKIN